MTADANGRAVRLGSEIGRGGEGAVYDILGRPGAAAKLYHKPPDQLRAEKITAMVAMATERLTALSAWPTATLHGPGGGVTGFVMPKLTGHRPVFQVYGPKLRLKQFPKADWRFLVHTAANVSRAFGVMHAHGLVIGDVNHANLFVATDATVRLIDADSMQVTQGARRWPCEVGVSTHQPPEMQGLPSWRDVVRTPNHDAFGLAVLIFQLLCMGRHPFSGRHNGPGEPPDIERAIAEARYAFSRDSRRTAMAPPPGSVPMSALPPAIRDLFEAAFAPGATPAGRPAADRWTAELSSLARTLVKCGSNAAHWHAPVAGACPWCEVESRSGVALFPAVFVTGQTGTGGILLLWQEIQALQPPAPLPALRRPDVSGARPSARVAAARRRLQRRRLLAASVLVACIGIILAAVPAPARTVLLLIVLTLAAVFWRLQQPPELAEARQSLAAIQARWTELQDRWREGPAARFPAARQALAALKAEHDALQPRRAREMQALQANRRAQQLQAHLEGFEIASVKIAGIGKAKVASLISYGIETAADIDPGRVQAVPGFGPQRTASLVAFRQACEAAFQFDATRAVAASDVAALDGLIGQRRAKLETELADGLAQLKAMLAAEARHRRHLEAAAAELEPRYAQALTDARALGVGT